MQQSLDPTSKGNSLFAEVQLCNRCLRICSEEVFYHKKSELCYIENIKVPDLSGTNLYSSNSSIPSVLNCQGTPQENNLHAQSKAGKIMTLMK